jgi:hypothetical protein
MSARKRVLLFGLLFASIVFLSFGHLSRQAFRYPPVKPPVFFNREPFSSLRRFVHGSPFFPFLSPLPVGEIVTQFDHPGDAV